jgi:hypothetical protein
MSTIHILPQAATNSGRPLKRELVAPGPNSEQPQRHDESMMYAWSIGTTPAARSLTQTPRSESCPPEVYIG